MLCGPKKMTYHVWLTGFLGFVSPGGKVEKIQEDSLDSIPSPSHSVKIQIMGGKFCLTFTEDEGDGIESRFPFKIFSTLP